MTSQTPYRAPRREPPYKLEVGDTLEISYVGSEKRLSGARFTVTILSLERDPSRYRLVVSGKGCGAMRLTCSIAEPWAGCSYRTINNHDYGWHIEFGRSASENAQ